MPRERKGAKNKAAAAVLDDGSEPIPVKAPKKRRGSAANSGAGGGAAGMRGQNAQNGDGSMMVPPQPLGSGYGDTLYASNPFDDTPTGPPMCGPPPGMMVGPGGPPPLPHGMMNHHHPHHPHHHHPHHHPHPPPPPPMHHHPGMMGPGPGPPPPMNRMMGPGMMGGPGPHHGGPRGHLPMPPGAKPPPPPGMMPMAPGPPPPPNMMPAGRTYPPEQTMVFNSANPNAPPIYPCGYCHKEIHENDQAVLCESGCNFWYHRFCVGISERAFTLLTQEVYAEWVCDNCLNSKNIPLIKFKS